MLLCAACTPWAAAKGWAPFSILMCRKPEHGQDRPKFADARKFVEKYLGKLNTSMVDTILSFAVNFNYQVYSISEQPNPPSTSTPHLILSLELRLIRLLSWLFLKSRNTRFISCNGCILVVPIS